MLRVRHITAPPTFFPPEPEEFAITDSFQALLSDLLNESIDQTSSYTAGISSQASPVDLTDGYLSSAPSEEFFSSVSRPASPPDTKPSSGVGPIKSKSTEQRRRSQINGGFSELHSLVPSLAKEHTASSSKAGKAVVLTKTADYIEKLRSERENIQDEADKLQSEINELNASISHYQAMLPETGLSMPPPNTEEDDKRRLKNFVTQRTVENYKFNIFSRFMEPLFKSYCDEVTSRSASDLSSSTDKWVKEKCDLPSLRPVVLNSLRTLASETSILTNPEKLQSEVYDQLKISLPNTETVVTTPSSAEYCSPIPIDSSTLLNYSQSPASMTEQSYSQQPDYSQQQLAFNYPYYT